MSFGRGSSGGDVDFIRRRAKAIHRSSGKGGDDYLAQNANRFHFAVPLKPQDKPVDFPKTFHRTLKTEYAVRYLQRERDEDEDVEIRHAHTPGCALATDHQNSKE